MKNRIETLDITVSAMAEEVMEIQKRAYEQEALLIGTKEIPPLHETVEELKQCGERFLGCYVDGVLAGVLSYKMNSNMLDIHRLFVDPEFHRQGFAQKLLDSIEGNNSGFEKVIVSTAAGNKPAIRFYEKNNFREVGKKKINSELVLIVFEK